MNYRELNSGELYEYKLRRDRNKCPCPVCGNSRVTAQDIATDDDVVYRDISCRDCSAVWVEFFTLTDVSINY